MSGSSPRRETHTLRRDTRETRDRLLDTTGELLAERGPTFGLPELARRSDVSVATVYRHFDTVYQAFEDFTLRLAADLANRLRMDELELSGRERFELACARWADAVAGWGRAAMSIHSTEGVLDRVRRGNPVTTPLHAALSMIVRQLIGEQDLPDQDIDCAVLLWITIFDERVIFDLAEVKGWSTGQIAEQLGEAVLGSLRGWHTTPEAAPDHA